MHPAVVVTVGDHTSFGSMASEVAHEAGKNFSQRSQRGIVVLIRFMLVMVPLVFVANGITKGDWLSAFYLNFHCSWTDAGNAADDRNYLSLRKVLCP